MPTRPSTLPSSSRRGRPARPAALPGAADVMRQVLGDGEHQRQRVLGGRHHRRDRRVADDDAGRGGVGDVDVVVADTDPRDDLERSGAGEGRRVPGRTAAGEDRVGGVEAVVGSGSDDDRPPVDEVAVDVGERMVDEEQRQRVSSIVGGPSRARWRQSGSIARRPTGRSPRPTTSSARYRASIDNIDAALVHLLAERFKITQEVGPLQGARSGCPPPTRCVRSSRWPGCGRSPSSPGSIRCSPRSSCASSSPRSSTITSSTPSSDRSTAIESRRMNERFDIAVIGGGPAGAAAATRARRAAARVWSCSRRAAHGRDKVCGDGLTPRAVAALERAQDPARRRPPHRRPADDRRQARSASCRGPAHAARFPAHGAVWPRRRLDAALIDAAVDAGADVRFETEVEPCSTTRGRVTGVVAGERRRSTPTSSCSPPARRARSPASSAPCAIPTSRTGWRSAPTSRARATPTAHIEACLTSGTSTAPGCPGYGWMFPCGDGTVNIGVGALSTMKGFKRLNLNTLLDSYRALVRRLVGDRPEPRPTAGLAAADERRAPPRAGLGRDRRRRRPDQPDERRGHRLRPRVGDARRRPVPRRPRHGAGASTTIRSASASTASCAPAGGSRS